MYVLKLHPSCQKMKGQENHVKGAWGKMHPTRDVHRPLQTLLTHTGQLDMDQLQSRGWWPYFILLRCKAMLAHLVRALMHLHEFLKFVSSRLCVVPCNSIAGRSPSPPSSPFFFWLAPQNLTIWLILWPRWGHVQVLVLCKGGLTQGLPQLEKRHWSGRLRLLLTFQVDLSHCIYWISKRLVVAEILILTGTKPCSRVFGTKSNSFTGQGDKRTFWNHTIINLEHLADVSGVCPGQQQGQSAPASMHSPGAQLLNPLWSTM